MARKTLYILAIGCMTSTLVYAQAPAPAKPCSTNEYRQFDFWEGEWEVKANGQLAGYNSIKLAHNQCVLTESYTTPSGYSGESLNIYDAVSGKWHQTWTDSAGTLLHLKGNVIDGAMVMEGNGVGPSGQPVVHRITWTPIKDTVRQHWQSRAVNSDTWQTVFDGMYYRRQ